MRASLRIRCWETNISSQGNSEVGRLLQVGKKDCLCSAFLVTFSPSCPLPKIGRKVETEATLASWLEKLHQIDLLGFSASSFSSSALMISLREEAVGECWQEWLRASWWWWWTQWWWRWIQWWYIDNDGHNDDQSNDQFLIWLLSRRGTGKLC